MRTRQLGVLHVRAWQAILGLVLSLGLVADTDAIIVGNTPMHYDESERRLDHSSPTPPTLELTSVRRGMGAIMVDSIAAFNSDGNIGSIHFRVSGATDDRTPSDGIGYRLHYVDGKLPQQLEISEGAFLGGPNLYWDDFPTWDQEPFLFRVWAIAVDRAGNESQPSNVVIVGHDGDSTWQKQQAEVHEERMRFYTRRLGSGQGSRETVSDVHADRYRPPAAIGDVYPSTVVGCLNHTRSGRVDRIQGDSMNSSIEDGRALTASELQQLRSMLLNPKSYVADEYMCEFLPRFAFTLEHESSSYLVDVSDDCYLVRVRIAGRDHFGNVAPATSSILRAFCDGVLKLPPLSESPPD